MQSTKKEISAVEIEENSIISFIDFGEHGWWSKEIRAKGALTWGFGKIQKLSECP